METKTFIGIDVSKLTLDVCVLHEDKNPEIYLVKNQIGALRSLFAKFRKLFDTEQILVCSEHTGHYSNILRAFCVENGIALWLESGAEIKMSSGVRRNKSDRADAMRIAIYARRFHDRARLETIEPVTMEEVRLLLSERELYVKERAKYRAQIKDLGKFMGKSIFKDRKRRMDKHVKLLTKSIEEIDTVIDELMANDAELSRQQEILMSIDGVGQQVALHTIMATRGFRKYRSGREFACHVGVAPFSFTSGTSQRSRNKVSNRANKKLKTLFHMAALSAIKMKGEFKDYFDRKVAEGKNKMTVINAVRAKIINRIFALIRENRTYIKNNEFNLCYP